MTNENFSKMLIEKCDIYYKNELLSEEKILNEYIKFLSNGFVSVEKKVLFGLHTGSICFDVITVLIASLGCISLDVTLNDEVLAKLNDGDMVVYKNKRYKWRGLSQTDFGKKFYYVLEQDARGNISSSKTYVPKGSEHLIKPYYGASTRTDGMGLKKKKSNREDFLAYLFQVPENKIPIMINASIVIVCEKEYFSELIKNIHINYDDGKKVELQDIITASYYTISGEEIQIGQNRLKMDSILKVTGNISSARDLVLDKNINKAVGLVLLNVSPRTMENSELTDILNRKSLKYISITGVYNALVGKYAINMKEKISLFACTKEYLEQMEYLERRQHEGTLSYELHNQMENIMYNNVFDYYVEGGWSWEDYKEIRNSLQILQGASWNEEEKNLFVKIALSLINLLNTAVFTMESMEDAIANGAVNISVTSPKVRIDNLWELANKSGVYEDICLQIIGGIEGKYKEIYSNNDKLRCIKEYIDDYYNDESKIILVVPKAYYIDIVNYNGIFSELKNLKLTTINKLDLHEYYDGVLVPGDIRSKQFDPLMYKTAMEIVVFVYKSEHETFCVRMKKNEQINQNINYAIGLDQKNDSEIIHEKEYNSKEIEVENEVYRFEETERLLERVNFYKVKNVKMHNFNDSGQPLVEVCSVGIFTDDESILFSKYYKAVVYDPKLCVVQEQDVSKLNIGDVLVFATRDSYTKNMVDIVFDKLLSSGQLNREMIDATEKAFYWKEALREYRDINKLTYHDLTERLCKYGCKVQEMAVRQWLSEESHIVGPRQEENIFQIAQLTGDTYLLKDSHGYFEACRLVRRQRKEVLNLIGKAIAEKLRGHMPECGGILECVYENIEKLSKTLELEEITVLDKSINVPLGIVNKPITDVEVLS